MRYVVGVQKLLNAEAEVSVMQKALEALQPELVIAAKKVAETVKVVEAESAEAAEVEKVVLTEEAAAGEQVEITLKFKNKI